MLRFILSILIGVADVAVRLDHVARIDGPDTVSYGSVAAATNVPDIGPTATYKKALIGAIVSPTLSNMGNDESCLEAIIACCRQRGATWNVNPIQLRLERAAAPDKFWVGFNCTNAGSNSYYQRTDRTDPLTITPLLDYGTPYLVAVYFDYDGLTEAPDTVDVWLGAIGPAGTATKYVLQIQEIADRCVLADAPFPLVFGGLDGTATHSSSPQIDLRFFGGDIQQGFITPHTPTSDPDWTTLMTALVRGTSPADISLRTWFPISATLGQYGASHFPMSSGALLTADVLNGPSGDLTLRGNAAQTTNFSGVDSMAAFSIQPADGVGVDFRYRDDTGANSQGSNTTIVFGDNGVGGIFYFVGVYSLADIASGATSIDADFALTVVSGDGINQTGVLSWKHGDLSALTETSTEANVGAYEASTTTIALVAAGGVAVADVSAFVQTAVDAGSDHILFAVTAPTDQFTVETSESATAANRPKLSGTYTEAAAGGGGISGVIGIATRILPLLRKYA
jgi:hypothetical protein